MFKQKTTFIVGAGASAEFGLPTGAGLLKKLLQQKPNADRDFKRRVPLKQYDLDSAVMDTYGHWPHHEIHAAPIIEKAKNTFEPSIDLFSFQNESILKSAKFFTSWSIQAEMIQSQREVDKWGSTHQILSY